MKVRVRRSTSEKQKMMASGWEGKLFKSKIAPRGLLGMIMIGNSVVVVVIQFLSGIVPLTEMAGFTSFLLQLLALRPSTCLVSGILLQTNLLCLFFHLLLPSSSLSLATHFKIQSNPQNTIVIPPQHMSIPSNSIRCC